MFVRRRRVSPPPLFLPTRGSTSSLAEETQLLSRVGLSANGPFKFSRPVCLTSPILSRVWGPTAIPVHILSFFFGTGWELGRQQQRRSFFPLDIFECRVCITRTTVQEKNQQICAFMFELRNHQAMIWCARNGVQAAAMVLVSKI